MPQHLRGPCALIALALLLPACGGTSGPMGPDKSGSVLPDNPSGTSTLKGLKLAPARVRRLSADEVHNSVRDVFFAGDDARVGRLSEGQVPGFDNSYDQLTVYLELVESLDNLATSVADSVVQDLDRLMPCEQDSSAQQACAEKFVAEYGKRLYRRPLDADETKRLLDVYAVGRSEIGHAEGVSAVTKAMLLSPNFLFRTELGQEVDADGSTSLDAYERAAALSYYLWRTTPDDALLAAADDGSLLTEAGLKSAISRMMNDPRARTNLRDFFLRWLQINPTHAAKDDKQFTPELAASMQRETELFVDNLLFKGDHRLSSLWTSTQSFANQRLLDFYGVTGSVGTKYQPVDLASRERKGILTHASFITTHTPSNDFSPIFIGALIRRSVLCQELLDPPSTVPEIPQDPNLSVREKLAVHRKNPACASCHELMDPIGFTFELYSPSGRLLDDAAALNLTGQGALTNTDVDGEIFGAVELSEQLAKSTQVRTCFVANVLEYLLGRKTSYDRGRTKTDEATLAKLLSGPFANDDMLAVFTESVLSESFLRRDASDLPTR